jgi:hypothetical protein
VAGPIQLTETDFDQIKKNLISYLKSTDKFTDFDFEASNLSVILNLIAYQSQLNAYSANMIANESFLTTASIRNNVVSSARQIGYTPRSSRSSRSEITFEFDLASGLDLEEVYPGGLPASLQIAPGPVFQVYSEDKTYTFNTVDTFTSSIASDGRSVFLNSIIYEGLRIRQTFVNDESDYAQRFILENEKIDTSIIRIEVQEDPNIELNTFYSQAINLTTLNQNSRVYWVEEVEDNQYEITFGDGVFGKKLQNGSKIFVEYLISTGEEANGIQGTNNFTFTGRVEDSFGNFLNVQPTVTQVSMSSGGSGTEETRDIKFRAPKNYAAQNRCVTTDDYEAVIRSVYPAVDDIYVYGGETLPIPEFGRVYVAIKPKSGITLNTTTKQFIRQSIESYRVASIDIKFIDPEVLYLEVDSLIFYDDRQTNLDAAGIIGGARVGLQKYADSPGVARFGGIVRYSKIVGLIDDSNDAITRNVSAIRMRKNLTIVPNTLASYEVCFENALDVDYHNSVLSTTGFYIDGSEEVHYMENIPPSCQDDSPELISPVRLFYLDERNIKITVEEEIGTLNFSNGELLFGIDSPIRIMSTVLKDDLIMIRTIPFNNGQMIESRGSVYMEFDVATSEINAIVDGGN